MILKNYLVVLIGFGLAACTATTSTPPKVSQAPAKDIGNPAMMDPGMPLAEPAALQGLNPRMVQAMVGEPTLVRRDENVQVMLYEAPDCVLEVVFYEPSPQAHFEATHVSARTRQGDETGAKDCLQGLLPGGQWLGTDH